MRRRFLFASIVLLSAPALRAAAPSGEKTAVVTSEKWRSAARQDVLAAYDVFLSNHPGVYDPRNPGFSGLLRQARHKALAVADRANTYAGYADALGAFSAELADGHARLLAKPPDQQIVPEWPGFSVAWRGKQLKIYHAGEHAPAPAGSQITKCDGRPIEEVVKARLSWRGMRINDAGHWWSRSPSSFLQTFNSSGIRPRSCIFRLPNGERREIELTWVPAPENVNDFIRNATDGERSEIDLTEPRSGLFLVGLSNFNPDSKGIAAYDRLFRDLDRRRNDLLHAQAVVLDMRHNDGGSSSWSRRVAEALWGKAAVAAALDDYYQTTTVWWRASKGNADYLAELEKQLRDAGQNGDADQVRKEVDGIRAMLALKQAYYVEGEIGQEPAKRAQIDFQVPVYVITPGRCASACLDAIDTFNRFPNVKLTGAPTASDTDYLDARLEELPSGYGQVIIPNKMWVGRPRKSGEIYTPDVLVTDLDWSTKTFLDRIEADLKARH